MQEPTPTGISKEWVVPTTIEWVLLSSESKATIDGLYKNMGDQRRCPDQVLMIKNPEESGYQKITTAISSGIDSVGMENVKQRKNVNILLNSIDYGDDSRIIIFPILPDTENMHVSDTNRVLNAANKILTTFGEQPIPAFTLQPSTTI